MELSMDLSEMKQVSGDKQDTHCSRSECVHVHVRTCSMCGSVICCGVKWCGVGVTGGGWVYRFPTFSAEVG